MLGKASIMACFYFLFGVGESADDMSITDVTTYTCQDKVVVMNTLINYKIKLTVSKVDINHKIIVNTKARKSTNMTGYCVVDLTDCDTSGDTNKGKCYCSLQEDEHFTSNVVVTANVGFNGLDLVAQLYGDEKLLYTASTALPKIFGDPIVSLEVDNKSIALSQCVISLTSDADLNVGFCAKNLHKPNLYIFWKDNDPRPSHDSDKECIRKKVAQNPKVTTSLRFSYGDKCGRNKDYKCLLSGRGKSEMTTLGPTTLKYYFYWFLPVPIVIVVIVIVSPMVFMLIKRGSCSSKESDTTTGGSSSASRSSYDSASAE